MDNRTFRLHYTDGPDARYPGGRCDMTSSYRKVYDRAGKLAVSLELNGAGQWQDVGEEHGAHSNHSASKHGFETTKEGEKHKENGKVLEHTENIKRRDQIKNVNVNLANARDVAEALD